MDLSKFLFMLPPLFMAIICIIRGLNICLGKIIIENRVITSMCIVGFSLLNGMGISIKAFLNNRYYPLIWLLGIGFILFIILKFICKYRYIIFYIDERDVMNLIENYLNNKDFKYIKNENHIKINDIGSLVVEKNYNMVNLTGKDIKDITIFKDIVSEISHMKNKRASIWSNMYFYIGCVYLITSILICIINK